MFMKKLDLLCLVGDKLTRMSFDKRKDEKVVGIFPFEKSSVFLYAEEIEEGKRFGANRELTPYIGFWKAIMRVKNEINATLSKLSLPIVEGRYFCSSCYNNDQNLIVTITKDNMTSDYCNDTETAKLRYCDVFETM